MIDLDFHASTPCDRRVALAMQPFLCDLHANPASSHARGRAAAAVLESARRDVALALGAAVQPSEVVFCPSATFANNLALRGLVVLHLAVSAIEHSSVLETARALADKGARLTVLPVDALGVVSLEALENALREGVGLVSVMAANNEVGAIQPLPAIAELCRKHGALLHTDAAQAFGRVDLSDDGGRPWADLVTVSGHKVYGPQGIAALYVRDGITLRPITTGGTHERGIVPGTPAVALAAGLGTACQILRAEGAAECVRLARLRDRLRHHLAAGLGDRLVVNGPWKMPPLVHDVVTGPTAGDWLGRSLAEHWIERGRLPGNLHVTILGVCPVRLFEALDGALSVSGAAACRGPGMSHVLAAMGAPDASQGAPVRFGLGRTTTAEDVDRAAALVVRAALALEGEGCIVTD